MSYEFVSKHYDENMKEARDYSAKLFWHHPKYTDYAKRLAEVFNKLENSGIHSYSDLIRQVESREKCVEFIKQTKLPFENLVLVLNHIFRWVLPHKLYLRELIDVGDENEKNYVEILRQGGVRFNLDILEHGWSEKGRKTLSQKTGVPGGFILSLVNRADMSRLPYSNRKTVKHLCLGGYDSIEKLTQIDRSQMINRMKSYFGKAGIKSSGFIDLEGIHRWANIIPRVVET